MKTNTLMMTELADVDCERIHGGNLLLILPGGVVRAAGEIADYVFRGNPPGGFDPAPITETHDGE